VQRACSKITLPSPHTISSLRRSGRPKKLAELRERGAQLLGIGEGLDATGVPLYSVGPEGRRPAGSFPPNRARISA
jgi:hypothetical protein